MAKSAAVIATACRTLDLWAHPLRTPRFGKLPSLGLPHQFIRPAFPVGTLCIKPGLGSRGAASLGAGLTPLLSSQSCCPLHAWAAGGEPVDGVTESGGGVLGEEAGAKAGAEWRPRRALLSNPPPHPLEKSESDGGQACASFKGRTQKGKGLLFK